MAEKRPKRGFRAIIGIAFLAALVVLGYVTIGLFNQDFTSTTEVTVDTPRAGLLMAPGSQVKLRGVKIGEVDDVVLKDDDTVRLTLGIYPDQLKYVASNVIANIIPPTVFGAKYVELIPPKNPVGTIQAGATIDASHVTVEINTAFTHLVDLLNVAQPAKVSRTLNALSTALKGNGNKTGNLIELADEYLQQLNPSLGYLREDVVKGSQVADNLATQIVPGLIKIGSNAATTSDTLVNSQASLAAVLADITSFGDKTTKFINNIRPTLNTALTYLQPVTQLLAEYAPILPCTLEGTNNLRKGIEVVIGGRGPYIHTYTTFLPGDTPYTNPKNLPVIAAKNAPSCAGLPNPGTTVSPAKTYDVGANPNVGKIPNAGAAGTPGGGAGAALGTTLFGTLAGLISAGGAVTGG